MLEETTESIQKILEQAREERKKNLLWKARKNYNQVMQKLLTLKRRPNQAPEKLKEVKELVEGVKKELLEVGNQLKKRLKKASRDRYKRRLFLGEADFSYTVALVKKHPEIPGARIIATEYADKNDLANIYNNFLENIQALEKNGVIIKLGVDARKLHENSEFKYKRVKRIQFNCPHDGSNYANPEKTLQKMIADFFVSARKLQKNGDHIQVVLPKPSDERLKPWMSSTPREFYYGPIYNIYDAARQAGYQFVKKRKFGKDRYPGYQHKITGQNATAGVTGELREYIFVKTDKTSDEILELSPRPLRKKIYDKAIATEKEFILLPEIPTDSDSSDCLDSEGTLSDSEILARNNILDRLSSIDTVEELTDKISAVDLQDNSANIGKALTFGYRGARPQRANSCPPSFATIKLNHQ